jgi:hypothetical protein
MAGLDLHVEEELEAEEGSVIQDGEQDRQPRFIAVR